MSNSEPVARSADPQAECSPTHFDREMAQVVITAINYLATHRGQLAINRLAQRDPELHRAITVTHHHSIPWHNLGVPGWKP